MRVPLTVLEFRDRAAAFYGDVEAVIDGPSDAVEAVLVWARRGPPSARVTEVRSEEVPGTFERFDLRSTV